MPDIQLDATDWKILARLQEDARVSNVDLAQAVHLSPSPCLNRVRALEADKLRLDFINDGSRYPNSPLTGEMPRSLSERVKLAGGVLELSRGMGVTRIAISLPISGRVN